MFIRVRNEDGVTILVNAEKIVEVYGIDDKTFPQAKSHTRVSMNPKENSFYSSETVTEIDQKLYRAGLINN